MQDEKNPNNERENAAHSILNKTTRAVKATLSERRITMLITSLVRKIVTIKRGHRIRSQGIYRAVEMADSGKNEKEQGSFAYPGDY